MRNKLVNIIVKIMSFSINMYQTLVCHNINMLVSTYFRYGIINLNKKENNS